MGMVERFDERRKGLQNPPEFSAKRINRVVSKGISYVYHRPTRTRLPDLPDDHPDMIAAIIEAEKAAQSQSDAKGLWGTGVAIPPKEQGISAMAPPSTPHVVAFAVPQVIRFVFRASKGDVVYYHHGNLLEDGRRDTHIRQKGRYVALCVSFGLLSPRQRRAFASETHYFAVRTDLSATAAGLPRNALDGTITPDEYEALHAIDERQASMATTRAIRDTLGISDHDAAEIRNEFIRRGWLTNGRPPEITDLGEQMMR